jgi:hypothetical protein
MLRRDRTSTALMSSDELEGEWRVAKEARGRRAGAVWPAAEIKNFGSGLAVSLTAIDDPRGNQ